MQKKKNQWKEDDRKGETHRQKRKTTQMALHTIDSSSTFSFVAISMSLIAIFGLRLVFSLIQTYFIRPWSAYKALVEQGFHVLPYPPVTGNFIELKRMDAEAQISPMPSPSHHHLLFDRICPFINKHISASHYQGRYILWSIAFAVAASHS